tara:strand:- start:116 stop:1591 length:1476 start_codon:yes stop_codon:yes gene_type:complete
MSLDREVFDKPGQYQLNEIHILSYRHNAEELLPLKMNIKPITLSFEIAEDIFSNNVVGSCIVYDMQDVRTMLPLTGLERLSLSFTSPGTIGFDFTDSTGIPLQIYKVDKVTKDDNQEKAQFYQIFFCSPEMYNNSITKISKAYAGPIENAINDILRNYLKSEKPFYFEPTATNPKIVIPNLKPYEAIRLLAKSAIPKNFPYNAGYVFYETSRGFYFRSTASMMAIGSVGAQITPKWKFTSLIPNVTEDEKRPEIKDVERRLSQVIRYSVDKPVDMLANINEGFYASKTTSHDAFNKTIEVYNFDSADRKEKTPRLEMGTEAGILYPKDVQYSDTGKPLTQHYDSKHMIKSSTKKIHNDYEDREGTFGLSMRTHDKQGYRNQNLTMLTFGNTILNAGDIVTFTSQIQAPTDQNEDGRVNPYTSGRYIIMALKHQVDVASQRHEMVLKCYKDSVSSAYPTEEEALSSIGQGLSSKTDIYEDQLKSFGGGLDYF